MRLTVKRLRMGLLAGALLLVGVLAIFIGYGRYRAVKVWQRLLKHSGATLTHETDGYTYTQSVGNKTIFTLHAAKAVQHDDGKWALHDVVLTFYGSTGEPADHVYGSDFEYDDKLGVARALGEVHMDLEAPTKAGEAGKPETAGDKVKSGDVIHVRTSGLVYIRKLGVAATDQMVEFQYGDVLGTSHGAEFYNGQNVLHLLADVRMDGMVRGTMMHMTATKADLDRTSNIGSFTQPVVTSDGRSMKAESAVVTLRRDSSIDHAEATGNVVMAAGTRQVSASRLVADMGPTSLPRTARFSGGVVLVDTDPLRTTHGAAGAVDATFDTQGHPTNVIATGGAGLSIVNRTAYAAGLRREIKGNKIEMLFVPAGPRPTVKAGSKDGVRLREAHAVGGASVLGDSVSVSGKAAAQLKTSQAAADDLRAEFVAGTDGRELIKTLHGTGHTQLEQDAPLGALQKSSGDTLEVSFAATAKPGGGESAQISTADQIGHVVLHSRAAQKPGAKAPAVTTASADRAQYDRAEQKLSLMGGAHVSDGTTEMAAGLLVLDQQSGDVEAHGSVVATMQGANGSVEADAKTKSVQVTHVMSADAKLEHEANKAEFHGTDAQPARMWQGASQVEAANLYFDGTQHTLEARPTAAGTLIHAVFAAANETTRPSEAAKTRKAGAGKVARIASQRMDYSDGKHEATFTGKVRIDGVMGDVRSEDAVVFLTPNKTADTAVANPSAASPFGGSVDHVVVSGGVELEQPGRHGTGETLLYTAASNEYVLTGTPVHLPKIVDAQQGSVTGTKLLFGDAGSTIIVSGDVEGNKAQHARVRTETDVRK